MKQLLALAIVLMSVSVFAKTAAAPSAQKVVDALALANPSDVAEFLKGGNVTSSIEYKQVSADEENYTMLRQSCSSNGLGPGQCLGGVQIRINIQSKIVMANRVKTGSSQISRLR